MMNEHQTTNRGDGRKSRFGPGWIVVSEPGAALYTEVLPLEGELKEGLTIKSPLLPAPRRPRPDSMFDENGYFKPPRLPRPDNLRWWERLAYAWRGL
jgi:hypothetical protein